MLLRGARCPKCSGIFNYKPFGYWNNLENCLEEANKYRNKSELGSNSSAVVRTMKINGWSHHLDEIYKDNIILYKDHDKKIHSICVYKLDIQNICYIGRTSCPKRRHNQHVKGSINSKKKIEYSSVYLYCKYNNLEIPEPIILEDKLNAQESRIREDFWLKKYQSEEWVILNKAKTGPHSGSLGSTILWTYEKCKEESLKYNYKQDMKKGNYGAYGAAYKNGWLNEFFPILKNKPMNYWNKEENVLEAAKDCTSVKDMIKKHGGAYNSARKNGWTHLLRFKEK